MLGFYLLIWAIFTAYLTICCRPWRGRADQARTG
jgi:succinate-acetate transporter protein